MKKVSFYIDGFNVYYSLALKKYRKYKWLNYMELGKRIIPHIPGDTLQKVHYFSAYTLPDPNDPDKVNRHRKYIKALKDAGVAVTLGHYKEKDVKCKACQTWFKHPEEKQTDVNIAVHLLRDAHLDEFDVAVLVSADTDMVLAIKVARATFPKKKFGVLFPIDRAAGGLKNACDFFVYTKTKHLRDSQFPDPLYLKNGQVLHCPPTWA